MRRKNREAHLWPLVNFASQLKQRPLSLQLAISSRVSLLKGKGGGLAGEGKRGSVGGKGEVSKLDGGWEMGSIYVRPRGS